MAKRASPTETLTSAYEPLSPVVVPRQSPDAHVTEVTAPARAPCLSFPVALDIHKSGGARDVHVVRPDNSVGGGSRVTVSVDD